MTESIILFPTHSFCTDGGKCALCLKPVKAGDSIKRKEIVTEAYSGRYYVHDECSNIYDKALLNNAPEYHI